MKIFYNTTLIAESESALYNGKDIILLDEVGNEIGVLENAIIENLGFEDGELLFDNSSRISELKQKLADTDYVIIKIAEGVATKEEYADIISLRQEWRREINELEQEVNDDI